MSEAASILTIGDELLFGDRVDTNGPWLSSQLSALGINTLEHCSVPDNIDLIASAINRLANASQILLVTGGLGPTKDDRTRKAFAAALGDELIFDQDAHQSMLTYFQKREAVMPKVNEVQAFRPYTATWIPNIHGTAPGLNATLNGCDVYCFPGPPSELQPMFGRIVENMDLALKCNSPRRIMELHAWGLPESIAGEKIKDLMDEKDPSVSILIGRSGITARVISSLNETSEEVIVEIKKRWSPWIYGSNEETLASSLGNILNGSLATAESCTAGLIGDLIGQVPGASDWFLGGWITYSNELKQTQLGIEPNLLEQYGAVSWQVAKMMAECACVKSGSSVGLSTTGIAGPTGGTHKKPVGTVFIGCTKNGSTEVREFRFTGTRDEIRIRAASSAIQMARLKCLGLVENQMCWQHGSVFR